MQSRTRCLESLLRVSEINQITSSMQPTGLGTGNTTLSRRVSEQLLSIFPHNYHTDSWNVRFWIRTCCIHGLLQLVNCLCRKRHFECIRITTVPVQNGLFVCCLQYLYILALIPDRSTPLPGPFEEPRERLRHAREAINLVIVRRNPALRCYPTPKLAPHERIWKGHRNMRALPLRYDGGSAGAGKRTGLHVIIDA